MKIYCLFLVVAVQTVTLTKDSTPVIRCSGGSNPVSDWTNTHLGDNPVIYIRSGDATLNMSCHIFDSSQRTGQMSRLTVTNVAYQLTIKLENSTWRSSFSFAPSDNNGQWNLSLDIERTFLIGRGRGEELIEDFMYTVHLDTLMCSSSGTIMFYDKQPLTQWSLGDIRQLPADIWSPVKTSGLIHRHHPCSGNIQVILPVTTEGLFLGLSTNSFRNEEVVWYDVTGNIRKACVQATVSQALCNQAIMLKDAILTNHHLLLVTSLGLYVSTKIINKPDDAQPVVGRVRWSKLNDSVDHVFLYTPVCLDPQRRCVLREQIDVTYRLPEKNVICYGFEPFTEKEWNCRSADVLQDNVKVIQIVTNRHTGAAIILQWNEILKRSSVTIAQPSLDLALFPTFTFPENLRFTRIKLHSQTMAIFLLGLQLWYSHDQGAHFYPMWRPPVNQIVTDVIFNCDGTRTELLAVAENSQQNTVSIAYGTLESRHVRPITTFPKPVAFHFPPNQGKTIQVFKIKDGRLVSHMMNDLSFKLNRKIYIQTNLALEFTSDKQHEAYELSVGPKAEYMLQRFHVGFTLVHINGGRAKIIGYHEKENGIDITLAVISPFHTAVDERESSLTTSSLSITKYNDTTAYITLNNLGESTHWSQEDIGKALVIALKSNYLTTSLVNGTTIMALSSSGNIPTRTVAAKHWRLLNFSAGSWWLEEGGCNQILQVFPQVSQNVIALDLGAKATFRIISSIEFEESSLLTQLHMEYSNPFLFTKLVETVDHRGYKETMLELMDKYFKPAISSLLVYFPHTSLQCPMTPRIYTVLLCCPYHKRIIFNYPQKVRPQMILDEHLPPDSVLIELPINYRPPSSLGIAIPLTPNVYNADPKQPLYKSKFKRSRTTARFKFNQSCQAASCSCTSTRRASRLVENSDCIRRVYKLNLPGTVYLCFAFQLLNTTTNQLFLSSIGDDYAVTLAEVNGRTDFYVEYQDHINGNHEISPKTLSNEGVHYKTNPYNLRLKMSGSGLYHFHSKVPEYMSYCHLQTQFIIFVDEPPVPYPFLFVMDFGVNIGMGFVMFLVYAAHRLNTTYAKHVIETHRPPSCSHATSGSRGVGKETPTRAVQGGSYAVSAYNRMTSTRHS